MQHSNQKFNYEKPEWKYDDYYTSTVETKFFISVRSPKNNFLFVWPAFIKIMG